MTRMIKSNWLTAAGLLLALPAACFFGINILHEMGISSPYNVSEPVLQSLGIEGKMGLNINLLIIMGPATCFLLSALQVVKTKWEFSKQDFNFSFTIDKRWFPILVGAFSMGLLTVLFFYLLGENCHC